MIGTMERLKPDGLTTRNAFNMAAMTPVQNRAYGFQQTKKASSPGIAGSKNLSGQTAETEEQHLRTPPRLTSDEEALRERSGHYIDNISINSGIENEEIEREKKEERQFRAFAEALGGGDFHFTEDSVISSLSQSILRDQSLLMINSGYREVGHNDILRLDASGNRISAADDPDGKHIVKTLEQKQAYEAKIGACVIGYAQEEISMGPDGRLVLTSTVNSDIHLNERIDRAQSTIDDVKNGKIAPDKIDSDLKNEILARHNAQKDGSADLQKDQGIATNDQTTGRTPDPVSAVYQPKPAPAQQPGL